MVKLQNDEEPQLANVAFQCRNAIPCHAERGFCQTQVTGPVLFAHVKKTVLQLSCYEKVLEFIMKNTRFTRKTLDYKSRPTHSENAQKMHCNANHRYCATHCKPPQKKKTGDSSNPFVCLCRSQKLLTDDQVTSLRLNSKQMILPCVIQDLIR